MDIDPLLEITGLTKNFGGVVALAQVDLRVMPGQIASLIGPNGAGKTTLFNCVTGLMAPTTGKISFQKQDILDLVAPGHCHNYRHASSHNSW